jgi:hypothetical protein
LKEAMMDSSPPDFLDWAFWVKDSASMRDLLVSLGAVIGLPLLIWREITGHRTANIAAERHEKQTEADRERRITDNFTKAVELLGKSELEVRLGAIYALERIASESKRDHWPVIETLTAYVRTKSTVQSDSQPNQSYPFDEAVSAYAVAVAEGTAEATQGKGKDQPTKLSVDIESVLTVLSRRIVEHEDKDQSIDLGGANLREADLGGANLGGANLREADLGGANLGGTYLRKANLIRADLGGANLIRADLTGVDLNRANLTGANLREANLREANLTGANLSQADLEEAKFCQTTMPDGTLNNRNCPPEEVPPEPIETPPAPN